MKPASQTLHRPAAVNRRGCEEAFTLIEMLTVVAIIAILAALIVALVAPAGERKVTSRVTAELNQLVGAIEAYKKKVGFYPPENTNNVIYPPLYYELKGIQPAPLVATSLYIAGIANTDNKDFHPQLKPKGFAGISMGPNPAVYFLTVPYRGPEGQFNTWRYRSLRPEHNTESFDLWAEVVQNGKTNIIGNWKE